MVATNWEKSVAAKSLFLFFGPKQYNINASGSKLYMNLKNNIFFLHL